MADEREKGSPPGSRRLAEATRAARTRGSETRQAGRRSGGAMDVFGGEIRRRDVFPLLVLHLIEREPAYGNRLIEEIEDITNGVISVNPNTIYPLLRDLEARGLIEGQWEHPDRRTRRFYSITAAGRKEYGRLVGEVEPFLDSVIKSVTLIKREIYSDPASGEDG
jgi:PadR family transcriptional regulator, regulatory protein PadR